MSVRPLDVEPEPRRRGLAIAAATVVVLGGAALWLATGPPSVSAPTTTSSSTTTTTTTPTTSPPQRLGRLLPGFQGRVRGVLTSLDDPESFSFTWASGESAPRLTPLPEDAAGTWDVGLERIAVVANSSFGRSLFFGPVSNVREVVNGVESFAWHDAEPAALAWLTVPQADGARELWRSLPPDALGTFSASLVARLDTEAAIVGYGDWGFALAATDANGARTVSTYSPAGDLIASRSAAFADSTPSGDLLLLTNPGGQNPHLAISGTDLAAPEPIGPDFALGGLFSPNGKWVAAVSPQSPGAMLWLGDRDGTVVQEATLGVDVAFPVVWTSDAAWIILRGSPDAPAVTGTTQLIFVRAAALDVWPVYTPGNVSGIVVESTGIAGPEFFVLP